MEVPGVDPALDSQSGDIGGIFRVVVGINDFCGLERAAFGRACGKQSLVGAHHGVLAFAVAVEFDLPFLVSLQDIVILYFLVLSAFLIFLP
jgi:hypothetical protein